MYCSNCKKDREFETHFRVIEGGQGKLLLFPEQICVECGKVEKSCFGELAGAAIRKISNRLYAENKGELLFKENA